MLVVEVLHLVREQADLAGDAICRQVAAVDEAVQVPDRQAEPLGRPDRGDPSVVGVHGPPPMLSGFRRRLDGPASPAIRSGEMTVRKTLLREVPRSTQGLQPYTRSYSVVICR